MTHDKQKTLINFKKAGSLLEKIIGMAEQDSYCIDIMQQNLAVIGLLKSVNQLLMKNHLQTCFRKAIRSKDKNKQQAMIEEILQVIKLGNK